MCGRRSMAMRCFAGVLLMLVAAVGVSGQGTSPPAVAVKKPPESIAPFFVPPKECAGQMGEFRSLMKFDDGREVKTPQDWAKRRAEIREYWEKKLGKWPALLERP